MIPALAKGTGENSVGTGVGRAWFFRVSWNEPALLHFSLNDARTSFFSFLLAVPPQYFKISGNPFYGDNLIAPVFRSRTRCSNLSFLACSRVQRRFRAAIRNSGLSSRIALFGWETQWLKGLVLFRLIGGFCCDLWKKAVDESDGMWEIVELNGDALAENFEVGFTLEWWILPVGTLWAEYSFAWLASRGSMNYVQSDNA